MEFSGRKVFVVGGSRGIGAAIVRHFAAAGAKVIFTYAASAAAADQLACETGAQALRIDAGAREEMIAAVRDAGPIDIFVYNAGLLVFGDAEGRAHPTKTECSCVRHRRRRLRSLRLRLLLPLRRPALRGSLVFRRMRGRGSRRPMVPAATLPPLN
jgi:NAD(P)-dependent dehydrogenase (short-subunit alcohol dehydrogenase family)